MSAGPGKAVASWARLTVLTLNKRLVFGPFNKSNPAFTIRIDSAEDSRYGAIGLPNPTDGGIVPRQFNGYQPDDTSRCAMPTHHSSKKEVYGIGRPCSIMPITPDQSLPRT